MLTMRKGVTTRSAFSMGLTEEHPNSDNSCSSSLDLNPREEPSTEASLTLSERHQLFQAYVLVGSGNCQPLHVKDSCTFYASLYSKKIKQAVSEFDFSENDTMVSTDIQYKGTQYKKGHFLVSKNDEAMEFGELLIILIKNDTEVYFVMAVHKADYHSEYHLYSVQKKAACCFVLKPVTW